MSDVIWTIAFAILFALPPYLYIKCDLGKVARKFHPKTATGIEMVAGVGWVVLFGYCCWLAGPSAKLSALDKSLVAPDVSAAIQPARGEVRRYACGDRKIVVVESPGGAVKVSWPCVLVTYTGQIPVSEVTPPCTAITLPWSRTPEQVYKLITLDQTGLPNGMATIVWLKWR